MQQKPKRFLMSLPILGDLGKGLASLSPWTEEEQEEAGIYVDRLGGEFISVECL